MLNMRPTFPPDDARNGGLVYAKGRSKVSVSLAVRGPKSHVDDFVGGEFGLGQRRTSSNSAPQNHVSLVFRVRSHAKVGYIAAKRIVARMKEVAPFRDFPVSCGPNKSVRLPISGPDTMQFPNIYHSVTRRRQGSDPLNAPAFSCFQPSFQEAVQRAVLLLRNRLRDKGVALGAWLFHGLNIVQGLARGN